MPFATIQSAINFLNSKLLFTKRLLKLERMPSEITSVINLTALSFLLSFILIFANRLTDPINILSALAMVRAFLEAVIS